MSSLTTKLDCRSLHQYLSDLPPAILDALYENPATCMAVLRELPELAKHYIMRILFVDTPIAVPAVSSWVTKDAKNDHKEAINILCELRIWVQLSLKGGLPAYSLSDTFRSSLKKALLGGGHLNAAAAQLEPDKNAKTPDSLEKYASERWEVLLHYLVGTQMAAVSGDIKDLLIQCGLMKIGEEGENVFITAKGFQFLLLDTPTQHCKFEMPRTYSGFEIYPLIYHICPLGMLEGAYFIGALNLTKNMNGKFASEVWFFILEYLEWIRKRGMNLVPILKFLFELSFTSLGMDLPSDGREEHVIQCLQHLREIGLIFQRKRTSRRFYPTNLAINLVNRQSLSFVNAKSKGFIIAETNYRVYSYTTSDLQYAIMSLFCDMLYRFPNLCIGQMTRESVQMAVSHGISAEQILHYLRANAHPDMLKNTPILPQTLEDQVRLWEMERDRLVYQEGVLYNQFLSQQDFELLRNYAQELQALVWQNEAKRYMVVNKLAHDQVKKFWKKHKRDNT